ncbi:hypothetical protein I7I53_06025 [Histoplasma capsulatum var. duboisii H88]|uniref:Uncharacterized protein n=1 Tax=Ajellomyces capsulatus (strain H88) TaxID=544711 RepID=A0A8A1L9V2_AJEC8|nr:hypothetical protein I7I53_06025 [Histoplasma capsulatum var. duboisii H88]
MASIRELFAAFISCLNSSVSIAIALFFLRSTVLVFPRRLIRSANCSFLFRILFSWYTKR